MILFYTPRGPGESELTEKRSRFLGHLVPVSSEEEARAFTDAVRRQYHDARHNCWCYRIRDGAERFADDGEPQGSAGMPMLEVFRRENVYNFACVVTRYFGGVLLGTGGLSRAYSAAAKEALTAAGTVGCQALAELEFSCSYSMADRLRKELESAGATVTDIRYESEVTVTAMLPEETAEAVCRRIRELSSGRVQPRRKGEDAHELSENGA